MSYPRLAAKLYNCPLMIEPGKAEVIEAVFRAYASGEKPAAGGWVDSEREREAHAARAANRSSISMERTDGGYLLTPDGVGILQIHGPLMQRTGTGIEAMSGGFTSYDRLAARFAAMEADPKVRATVLEFDTPGGEAAGVFDLGAQFAAAKKPVYAHANEMAFSAGYALASSAIEGLFMPGPAMVGSVGVIMMHVDQSQMDAKRGLVYTPIFAGARKADFSSHAPLSGPAKAMAQAEVDRLYQFFIDHVAAMRGIDPAVVRGTEAALLTPGQAIDLRMADGIESFAETIQRAADESAAASFTGFSPRRAGASTQQEANMAETNPKAPAFTAEDVDKARAEGRAAAEKDAATAAQAATAAGAKAAQERIAAILGHDEAKGRGALAQHLAFKTGMSVDDAIAALAAAPKEAAAPKNPLAEAMAKVPNPKVDADGEPEKTEVTAPIASKVYAFRRECVAKARGAK